MLQKTEMSVYEVLAVGVEDQKEPMMNFSYMQSKTRENRKEKAIEEEMYDQGKHDTVLGSFHDGAGRRNQYRQE